MNSKLKGLIIFVCIIGCIIWAIFWVETRVQLDYKDPFKVSKNFAYGLLMENKHIMKEWSGNKELDIKIDNLFKTDEDRYSDDIYHNFYLSGWSNLCPFIIGTYSIETSDDNGQPYIFCYTVELEAKRSETLWEKFRDVVYHIPLIGKQFGIPPDSKPKWIVKDFYNKDNFVTWSNESAEKSVKDIEIFLKLSKKEMDEQIKKNEEEEIKSDSMKWSKMIDIISNKERDNWIRMDLVKQNEETKSLIMEYNQAYTTPLLKALERKFGRCLVTGEKKK